MIWSFVICGGGKAARWTCDPEDTGNAAILEMYHERSVCISSVTSTAQTPEGHAHPGAVLFENESFQWGVRRGLSCFSHLQHKHRQERSCQMPHIYKNVATNTMKFSGINVFRRSIIFCTNILRALSLAPSGGHCVKCTFQKLPISFPVSEKKLYFIENS